MPMIQSVISWQMFPTLRQPFDSGRQSIVCWNRFDPHLRPFRQRDARRQHNDAILNFPNHAHTLLWLFLQQTQRRTHESRARSD